MYFEGTNIQNTGANTLSLLLSVLEPNTKTLPGRRRPEHVFTGKNKVPYCIKTQQWQHGNPFKPCMVVCSILTKCTSVKDLFNKTCQERFCMPDVLLPYLFIYFLLKNEYKSHYIDHFIKDNNKAKTSNN